VFIPQAPFTPPRNILQARAGVGACPCAPPPKKTPLHSKKLASPSVSGVASRTKLPEMKVFMLLLKVCKKLKMNL
jgi:hypothetical protein